MNSRPSTTPTGANVRLPEGFHQSAQPAAVLEALLREGAVDQLVAANTALGSPVRPEVMAALQGRTGQMARELAAIDTQVLDPLREAIRTRREAVKRAIEESLLERAVAAEEAFREYRKGQETFDNRQDLVQILRNFCRKQGLTLANPPDEEGVISIPELSRVIYQTTIGAVEIAVSLYAENELRAYERPANRGFHWTWTDC